jgi:hypothetical protein
MTYRRAATTAAVAATASAAGAGVQPARHHSVSRWVTGSPVVVAISRASSLLPAPPGPMTATRSMSGHGNRLAAALVVGWGLYSRSRSCTSRVKLEVEMWAATELFDES